MTILKHSKKKGKLPIEKTAYKTKRQKMQGKFSVSAKGPKHYSGVSYFVSLQHLQTIVLQDHGLYLAINEKPNNFHFYKQIKGPCANKGDLVGFFNKEFVLFLMAQNVITCWQNKIKTIGKETKQRNLHLITEKYQSIRYLMKMLQLLMIMTMIWWRRIQQKKRSRVQM